MILGTKFQQIGISTFVYQTVVSISKMKIWPLQSNSTVKIDLSGLEQTCQGLNINLTQEAKILITRLINIHFTGQLHLSRSSDDIELSIPDPELLKLDGPKELYSKHLYVNISKILRDDHKGAACCIKNMHFYFIDELTSMKPLLERTDLGWDPVRYTKHFKDHLIIPEIITNDDKNSIINNPLEPVISVGKCVPITQLPNDHPAIIYLLNRGFTFDNLKQLECQFNTRFCIEENARFKHIFGRDNEESIASFNPLSFFTPQGRLVFSAIQDGVECLWQARVLETNVLNSKFYYTYLGENDERTGWVKVAEKSTVDNKYKTLPDLNHSVIKRKYIISPGAKSSECLMGFDAALKWNESNNIPSDKRIIGLCEGVLDAGKMGPPFCSVMRASISRAQFQLIMDRFKHIYFACDHDEAGASLRESLIQKQQSIPNADQIIQLHELEYPICYKDLGEIKDEQEIKKIKEQIKNT